MIRLEVSVTIRIAQSYGWTFKAHVALAVRRYEYQLLERAAGISDAGTQEAPLDLAPLHAKIRRLALETLIFRRRSHQGRMAERKAMIDRCSRAPANCRSGPCASMAGRKNR